MFHLKPGPPGDAKGAIGAIAKVFVTSDDDPMMAIQNAKLKKKALEVDDEGTAELKPLEKGSNQLDLLVTSGKTGDEVVLNEEGEDGETQVLARSFIGGGDDPHVGFNIHGS